MTLCFSTSKPRNSLCFLLLILVACVFLTACSAAATPDRIEGPVLTSNAPPGTPTPIPNPKAMAVLDQNFEGFYAFLQGEELTISQSELEALVDQGFEQLYDLRKPLTVKETGFISGAKLIPLRELGRKTSVLPNYDIPLVFYCQETAECLIGLTGLGVYGWNIRILEGGFTGWVEAGRPVSQGQIQVPEPDPYKPAFPCCGIFTQSAEVAANPNAPEASLVAATDRMFNRIPDDLGAVTATELFQEIIEDHALVVLDVRQDTDFQEGNQISAPNLLHIPFDHLIDSREFWPAEKNTPIVVYCQDDRLAPIVMATMWAYGYENTRHLQGGLEAWKRAVDGK